MKLLEKIVNYFSKLFIKFILKLKFHEFIQKKGKRLITLVFINTENLFIVNNYTYF